MKINKLSASFGKLENETLKFHDGLNIISAPNESGKSTWCAFIRAMLYGIDTSERARNGYLPDKIRYAPWSGAPMEGSMDLTVNDYKISITRSSRSKAAPMREFSAVYTGTNTKVDELNSQNAGEQLTGVSKDVFTRSAFVAQGKISVSGSPELEKRISSIVSSGEEDSSFSEADERLRAWQRKRRYNSHGMLPELETQIDDSEKKLTEMNGSLDELELLEGKLSKARQECVELESGGIKSRKRQRKDSLNRLSSGRTELKEKSDEHDRAMAELSKCRDELRSSRFGDRTGEELEKEVNSDVERLNSLSENNKSFFVVLPAVICFVLAIVFAALYTSRSSVGFIIAAAVFCIVAVVLLLRYAKLKQEALKSQEERRQILKKYKADDADGIFEILDKHWALCNAVADAEQLELQTHDAYEIAHERQAELESRALSDLDFASGSSDAARLSRELADARMNAEQISSQIAGLRGRLSAMGDPLVLASDLSCMKEEYHDIQDEFDAISLAQEVLTEADKEMQSRFSPEIGKLAAKYMASITGGKYEDILINRDFSAKTRADGDLVARDAEYLSAGTLDLMYLAVRLAVCELALPSGEPCPLIIDDALVNLDDQRYDQAIDLLKKIAKKRQVILFTCREYIPE